MMYMHYCPTCRRIHMLNGHKYSCPRCEQPLTELKISYMDYIDLDSEKRAQLERRCGDPEELEKLKTTYRMAKYSKWYRKIQEQAAETSGEDATDNK